MKTTKKPQPEHDPAPDLSSPVRWKRSMVELLPDILGWSRKNNVFIDDALQLAHLMRAIKVNKQAVRYHKQQLHSFTPYMETLVLPSQVSDLFDDLDSYSTVSDWQRVQLRSIALLVTGLLSAVDERHRYLCDLQNITSRYANSSPGRWADLRRLVIEMIPIERPQKVGESAGAHKEDR